MSFQAALLLAATIDTLDILQPQKLDEATERLYYDLAFVHGFSKGEALTPELANTFRKLEMWASPHQVSVRFQWGLYGLRWSRYKASDNQMTPEEFSMLIMALGVHERVGILLGD
jgi:hypothetical protein